MADRVLDGLLELLRDGYDSGREIVYRPGWEPHPATRRLMATLGVRIEVAPVRAYTAMELGTSRDCVAPSCLNEAEPGTDRCRRHTQTVPSRPATGVGRGAPSRADTRPDTNHREIAAAPVVEPKREDTEVDTKTGWSRKPVTREEAIAALTAAFSELGHVPNRQGWNDLRRRPSISALDRIFGDYDAAVRACGLTPPPKGVAAKTWERSEIVAAFARFRAEEGRAPKQMPGDKRPWLPSVNAVKRVFGTWAAATAQASGGEPKGPAAATAEAGHLTTSDPAPPASPVAQSPVAPPEPPADTGEAGSLPEPPSEPAELAGSSGERTLAATPEPTGNGGSAAGSENAFSLLDLLALIRDLDSGEVYSLRRLDDDGTVEVAEKEAALVRRLARAALSKAPLADLGAAVLAQLDETA